MSQSIPYKQNDKSINIFSFFKFKIRLSIVTRLFYLFYEHLKPKIKIKYQSSTLHDVVVNM